MVNNACKGCGCAFNECECARVEEGGIAPLPFRQELVQSVAELVGYIDKVGGYMTVEDQAVLWRAKALLGRAYRRR